MDSFRLPMILGVLILVLCGTVACNSGSIAPPVIWNLADGDHLDLQNSSIQIHDDVVQVDLTQPDANCPSGLGDVIDGPPKIESIEFKYDIPKKGKYWLHIIWNPGGSGDEQFEVLQDGTSIGKTPVAKGSDTSTDRTDSFEIAQNSGINEFTLRRISGDGLHFRRLALTSTPDLSAATEKQVKESVPSSPAPAAVESHAAIPTHEDTAEKTVSQQVNPSLPFKDEAAYSGVIGEPGILLTSEHVLMFAPRSRTTEAQTIFPYLTKAYDALYRIVGVDTKYKIIVYHFPKGSQYARGGTSECTLWYGYPNLELENQEEWTKYHVPHVSGYIEEMGHNFVDATKANFGWEMVGWNLGVHASLVVADNPSFRLDLANTRQVQSETFQRYQADGNVFPYDIEPNLCDRIHAYVLWQCEQEYGENFWRDFFTEVRKEHDELYGAISEPNDDAVRNARYRLTIECFNRLPNLHFKERLDQAGISRVTAIQSFHPTEPGWNHRLE